ncbi:ABC transporter substrate-binding protein [Pseudahrensia aquimaris]|uniref:ABC transporter substrate-binding protein n=1 Tax=Pseudahrensia aquimaris TaxID=744461 RepID=A0ABW3FHK6_9HYPH
MSNLRLSLNPRRKPCALISALLFVLFISQSARADEFVHGIAMQGEPALPANFTHLPYANPNAPKGGRIVYGVGGSFDSLNPFIVKSIRTTARGLWDPAFGNLVFETLLKRSRDEPFTLYGLLAQGIAMPDDRSWIEFEMDADAKFSDGQPVTVEDVMFTFNLLKEKGRPPYSSRMKQVEKMERVADNRVRLTFNATASRETPLLFGLMPVLPKHATNAETFDQSTLVPPIGSGPYTVKTVKPGEQIVFQRNDDYWGKDKPVNRGFYNFDEVRVDYYRNASAQFEAFKKGLFDVRTESSPAKWETGYDFAAATDGRIEKDIIPSRTPSGMLGFVFNTRRAPFDNRNVRKALAMAFDFEWANENLFFGAYQRTSSYWQDSELSSLGVPADDREKALLADYPDAVLPEVMDGTYRAPITDGTGRDRKVLREVLSILRSEGYSLDSGQMVDTSGRQLSFEVLIAGGAGLSGQDLERLVLSYKNTLAKLGIALEPRFVDDSQFQARKGSFDYDMTINRYSSSLSPGAEQVFRWGSSSRDQEGSFNFAGTAEPVIDTLIDAMLAARNREDFRAAVRAFDRVLISGHYVVPLYHIGERRLAHWARVSHPEYVPLYGPQYPTWWATEQ